MLYYFVLKFIINTFFQIFLTYSNFFYCETFDDRKAKLEPYDFTCDCPACKGNWPPMLGNTDTPCTILLEVRY